MNKLREKIFAWRLKRQTARQIVMPTWDNIRSVAILYNNDNIQSIIQDIEKQTKEVVLFTMPDKKDIFWLTGRPKSSIQKILTAREFDLLIDLTQQKSLTMHYMAMYIRADFKTGRHIREGIHDLTISTEAQETPQYLYEQIVRYIKMFGRR